MQLSILIDDLDTTIVNTMAYLEEKKTYYKLYLLVFRDEVNKRHIG